jgi:4a-hydroxytetrahydrobiopterin dehydratase
MHVILYSRRGCHLCDEAKAAIRTSGVHAHVTEIDIDRDPELQRRYTNDVPVIVVDGKEAFRHSVDAQAFARYADSHPPAQRRSDMSTLAGEKCVPCRGGVPALQGEELRSLQQELGGGWNIVNEHHLEKEFTFPDFASALAFTNRVGAIAEEEGHHPDIYLGWGKVRITIWTHKADGLTRSDFVLAAKIDRPASSS